jgi:hypothetical protein
MWVGGDRSQQCRKPTLTIQESMQEGGKLHFEIVEKLGGEADHRDGAHKMDCLEAAGSQYSDRGH